MCVDLGQCIMDNDISDLHRLDEIRPIDTAILNLLKEIHPHLMSNSAIALNLEYNRVYCARRAKLLHDRGLLQRERAGDYEGHREYGDSIPYYQLSEDLVDYLENRKNSLAFVGDP